MHRFVAIACTLAALTSFRGLAHADDPRDLFGLGTPPATRAPATTPGATPDCADGRAFGCARATDALADDAPEPYALSTWLPGSYLRSLPVAAATHDQVAAYALGAGTDGAGVVLGGASGAENRWTVDGAPIDHARNGTADTQIPLVFLAGLRVTAGGFGAKDRTSTGGTIDAQLLGGTAHHEVTAYAWLGQPAADRAAPTPNETFQIRTASLDRGPTATAALVATGPLPHGGWYAAGIQPTIALDHVEWDAHRLVDANGDGRADHTSTNGFVTAPIDSYRTSARPSSIPAMLRAGWDGGIHHVDLTLLGNDDHTQHFLGNATLPAAGVSASYLTLDGIATYRARTPATTVRVQLSWHHSSYRESASDATAAHTPQVLDAYLPAAFPDAALVAGCAVGATATFNPCPIPGYLATGGAGLLTAERSDRPAASAEVAHRFGANTVRIGATDEDARVIVTQRYTGGSQVRSLYDGYTSATRFVDPSAPCGEDPGSPCTTSPSAQTTWRTRSTAGFIEDTFQMSPHLVANAGVRFEMDQVGDALVFRDEPAPRLGVAWDPIGGGRSRVWTSMGRTYPLLVAGMGATVLGTPSTVEDTSSPFATSRTIIHGNPYGVAPGIEPATQDEVTAGAEAALPGAIRVTTWVSARYLRRGYETIFNRFDNPGREDATLPEATRDSRTIAFELASPPDGPVALRAGYTYTVTAGTEPGAYDPLEGLILYAGSAYDDQGGNLYGRLPTDLAHRVYFEAGRRGHLFGIDVGATTRLTVQSGAVRDAVANTDQGLVELLPRGGDGRLPMTSQANVRLSARLRRAEVTLDLFDLFDRRDPTAVGEVYATDALRPIGAGTASDLLWLRTTDGRVPARDPRFHLPTQFQAPFSIVLGARYAF